MPLLLFLLAVACVQRVHVDPQPDNDLAVTEWSALLDRATHGDRVDYDLLERDHAVLQRYLGWVAVHGPESDSMRESAEDKRIAFLLNAYNAAVIEGVLRNRPIDSVLDVQIGLFRWRGAGFYLGQQFRVDGEWVSLYYLGTQYILGRYQEPLLHVALSCASASCPPVGWWSSHSLQNQLKRSMRSWLKSEQGLRRDGQGWAANELFFRHEEDFLDWGLSDNLCEWMAPYAHASAKAWLQLHRDDCTLGHIPADWGLNSFNRHPARERP